MVSSRRPELCLSHPSPIALLPNIITSINIRSPDRSEVVKKTRAITLLGDYLCWKTSPQQYHVMRLVGETSWQESDQLDNFDCAVEVP
jgi:hypothetical protein